MTYPLAAWRLLLSAECDGAGNMSIDEAVLLAVAGGRAAPTLRFFAWQPPCLSLGYAQASSEVDPERLQSRGYDLVRRPTGGRAILHTDELTYSVIAPMDDPRVRGGVVESYRQLSAGLMRGLGHLALNARADQTYAPEAGAAKGPVCFEVPSNYEITVGTVDRPRKLLGSAQVRKRGVVLQHGSLPLAGDIARICDVLAFDSDAERERARQRVYQRAATLAEVAGREVSWNEAASAMSAGFADALNLSLADAPLSSEEQAEVARLRAGKYTAESWNLRI